MTKANFKVLEVKTVTEIDSVTYKCCGKTNTVSRPLPKLIACPKCQRGVELETLK